MPIIIRKPKLIVPAAPLVKPSKVAWHKPLDHLCRAALSAGPGAAVSWFLMASYLYYVHDMSLLTDELYDKLAAQLKSTISSISHPHKHLITQAHLQAGTMYDLKEKDYPLMVRNAAAHLARFDWGVTIHVVL